METQIVQNAFCKTQSIQGLNSTITQVWVPNALQSVCQRLQSCRVFSTCKLPFYPSGTVSFTGNVSGELKSPVSNYTGLKSSRKIYPLFQTKYFQNLLHTKYSKQCKSHFQTVPFSKQSCQSIQIHFQIKPGHSIHLR